MNSDDYKKMLRAQQESRQGSSAVTEVKNGKFIDAYFDARQYARFSADTSNAVGQLSTGAKIQNQPVRLGDDPFKKYLHKARGRGDKPDHAAVEKALFQLPRYDPNFHVLHEVLSNTRWSKEEQTQVLRQVLHYEQDIDRPLKGASPQTALEKAFETKNESAALLLVARGSDLQNLNVRGYSAIHHAARSGMPETLAVIARRGGAHDRKTAGGHSVADLVTDYFAKEISGPSDMLTQDKFENALNTYYKSMAVTRQFKLHSGPWDFSEHKKELNELTKSFPQYRPFIETMANKLDSIVPYKEEEIRPYPPSKSYTNPGGGLNDPVLNTYNHSWLGFLSFLDDSRENDERNVILINSESKARICLRNMDQLTDPATILYLQQNRPKLNLDVVVTDKTLNPHGDTLLTRAIRDKKYDCATELLKLNVNMHATDAQGNTALHLLAQTCTDKEAFLTLAKQMIGVPAKDGAYTALLAHGNKADWYIPNANGETFIDVMHKHHPEWSYDPEIKDYPAGSWFKDIEEQLNIPGTRNEIPEWSVEKILRLGGPEEVLRIEKNADPLLLTNRVLPTLEPLSPYATKAERDTQVHLLCGAVTKLQTLKQDAQPEERQEINKRLEQIIGGQDPETKMRAMLFFTDAMANLDAGQMEGQIAIMRSLSHDLKHGDEKAKEHIFAPFHETTKEMQRNIVHFFQGQEVLQAPKADATVEEQNRMQEAIENFGDAAKMFTKEMENYAQQKWGAENNRNQADIEDVQIKNTNNKTGM